MKKWLAIFFLVLCLFFVAKKRERIALWWAIQPSPPAWAEQQIAQDLAACTKVTQEALNETFEKVQEAHLAHFRYRIIDGTIYRQGQANERSRVFEKMLRRIQKSRHLPNVDFIICMNDGVPECYAPPRFWITEKQAPLFAWAKRKDCAPHVVLIPDCLTTREASWNLQIETIEECYRAIPWEKRKELAFWRGASNDKAYSLENFWTKPRFLISFLSQQYPALIDAQFSHIHPAEVAQAIADLGLQTGHATTAEHLGYKYLPVLDGYMCTFPGFQWRLLSGSLPLKQESEEVQYFYAALQPYVHYLPIKNDMSDLVEKIRWAQQHDRECHQIAENARKFALANLMPNQIYAYLYWVLERYAERQTFTLEKEKMGSEWENLSQ